LRFSADRGLLSVQLRCVILFQYWTESFAFCSLFQNVSRSRLDWRSHWKCRLSYSSWWYPNRCSRKWEMFATLSWSRRCKGTDVSCYFLNVGCFWSIWFYRSSKIVCSSFNISSICSPSSKFIRWINSYNSTSEFAFLSEYQKSS
jgi:hypothetical protein